MGQKMACLGHRGTARSRQDESKEVGEAGSKRTSSGGNGGHHVWWSGLIFRLLPSASKGGQTHAYRQKRLFQTAVGRIPQADCQIGNLAVGGGWGVWARGGAAARGAPM
jgi:hypothetical protein